MGYENYKFLKVKIENGVAFTTIDHPPINLLTDELLGEFNMFADEFVADENVRVVVFRSDHPEFFINHYLFMIPE